MSSFPAIPSASARASVPAAGGRFSGKERVSSPHQAGAFPFSKEVGLQAYAPGIYPRSDEVIRATRDLDRGRTTREVVEEAFTRDLERLVAAQEDAGLDLLSDGLLRWQDHFRPLVDASEGLDARPLTRFLDTNTFYRAVLVDGEPRLGTPLPAPDLPEGRWLATLPSPLAFARAANGAISAQALAANVLAPQIDAYAEAGCSLVVLWDPFLAREPDALDQAWPALAELPRSVRIALHLAFGDAEAVLPRLADAPVDAIGVDFYATRVEAVPEGFPKELLAGVIDSRTSALEEPAEIARFRDAVAERVANSVALVPNGDLQFVPEPIARAKLACLGHARISEGVPA